MFVLSHVERKHVSKLLRKTLMRNKDIKYWEIDGGEKAYIQDLGAGEKHFIK